MEKEVQVILWLMVDIIPIDLVVDMPVPMVPEVLVMVVPQMILMEVAQIVPLPLTLGDNVDMINIPNSRNILNKM